MGTFNNATIHVETEKHGELVFSYLTSYQSKLELAARGAHPCLEDRYLGAVWNWKPTQANKISRDMAYRSWLQEVEIKDPDIYHQMLTLDPFTNEARRKGVDHDDYLQAGDIAWASHERASRRPAEELDVSVVRRRKRR